MALPAVLRDIFDSRRVWNDQGAAVELSSNISEDEAMLLHAAVHELRPRTSLEIGFAQGVSTLAMLAALRRNGQGHHHVLDPFQTRYGNSGRAMVQRAGLAEWYTFHEKLAEDVIPGLPRLQFAFIDSSHLFDLTVAEFVLTDRKMEVGGVIGFHDLWMDSQQSFIRFVLANRAYAVWQPSGWPTSQRGATSGWKRLVRQACARMPRASRVFAISFLQPWQEFGLGNLVLLRKTAEDNRDWRFHRRF